MGYGIGGHAATVFALHLPAGIIDSAEAQMKLSLNGWVCTDMNVC